MDEVKRHRPALAECLVRQRALAAAEVTGADALVAQRQELSRMAGRRALGIRARRRLADLETVLHRRRADSMAAMEKLAAMESLVGALVAGSGRATSIGPGPSASAPSVLRGTYTEFFNRGEVGTR